MKQVRLIIFILVCSLSAIAQQQSAKAYKKNSSNIELGYGIYNFWTGVLDKGVQIPGYTTNSLGPFSIIYEYGITKRFSGGAALSCSRVRGESKRFQIADQITTWSVLLRANYHFFTSAKLDPYVGGGVGISRSIYKNLDPNTVATDYEGNVPNTFEPNVQLGIKYFPLEHFGFCAEIGYVGGALGLIGIAAKF
jgi:outer membrane protein W